MANKGGASQKRYLWDERAKMRSSSAKCFRKFQAREDAARRRVASQKKLLRHEFAQLRSIRQGVSLIMVGSKQKYRGELPQKYWLKEEFSRESVPQR